MKQALLTDNYKKHTSTNPMQRYFIKQFYRVVLEELRPLPIKKILDAGCGEGETLAELAKASIGKDLIGIDFLASAIKIGKHEHPKLDLRRGTIYRLPFSDNTFDLVLCTEVLEHLDYPGKGLSEIHRVTKKYVLLSVPNEPFFMAANFLRGKNVSRFGNDIEHINHWTSPAFTRFVKHAGFTIVKKRHAFPWTVILAEKR